MVRNTKVERSEDRQQLYIKLVVSISEVRLKTVRLGPYARLGLSNATLSKHYNSLDYNLNSGRVCSLCVSEHYIGTKLKFGRMLEVVTNLETGTKL